MCAFPAASTAPPKGAKGKGGSGEGPGQGCAQERSWRLAGSGDWLSDVCSQPCWDFPIIYTNNPPLMFKSVQSGLLLLLTSRFPMQSPCEIYESSCSLDNFGKQRWTQKSKILNSGLSKVFLLTLIKTFSSLTSMSFRLKKKSNSWHSQQFKITCSSLKTVSPKII